MLPNCGIPCKKTQQSSQLLFQEILPKQLLLKNQSYTNKHDAGFIDSHAKDVCWVPNMCQALKVLEDEDDINAPLPSATNVLVQVVNKHLEKHFILYSDRSIPRPEGTHCRDPYFSLEGWRKKNLKLEEWEELCMFTLFYKKILNMTFQWIPRLLWILKSRRKTSQK